MLESEKDFYKSILTCKNVSEVLQDRIFAANDKDLNVLLLKLNNLKPEIDESFRNTKVASCLTMWVNRPERTDEEIEEVIERTSSLQVLKKLASNENLSFKAFEKMSSKANFALALKLLKNVNYPSSLKVTLYEQISTKRYDAVLDTSSLNAKSLKENEEFFFATKSDKKMSSNFLGALAYIISGPYGNNPERISAKNLISFFENNFSTKLPITDLENFFIILKASLEANDKNSADFLKIKNFTLELVKKHLSFFKTDAAFNEDNYYTSTAKEIIKNAVLELKVNAIYDTCNTINDVLSIADTYSDPSKPNEEAAVRQMLLAKLLTTDSLNEEDFVYVCKELKAKNTSLDSICTRFTFMQTVYENILNYYNSNAYRKAILMTVGTKGYIRYNTLGLISEATDAKECLKQFLLNCPPAEVRDLINAKSLYETNFFDFNLLKIAPVTVLSQLFSNKGIYVPVKFTESILEELMLHLEESFKHAPEACYEIFFTLLPEFVGSVESLIDTAAFV